MAPSLSVVAPVFNEQGNLRELCTRVVAATGRDFASCEIVLVDDGSHDGSWRTIQHLCAEFPQIRGLQLSRNSGEHIAVSAGMEHAGGDYVVIMDSDLQDPPEAIPELFATLRRGHYDMVYAVRCHRQHGWLKRKTSALFWLLLRWLTGLDIPRDQATLRLMTRRFRDALCSLPERNRFVYGLSTAIGFPQTGIPVEHGKRKYGRTSYNLWRLLRLAGNGVTSLSVLPLVLPFLLGAVLSAVAAAFACQLMIEYFFFDRKHEGWSSVMAALLLLGGVQLTMIGIVGIYLGKTYIETKARPLYFIAGDTRALVAQRPERAVRALQAGAAS